MMHLWTRLNFFLTKFLLFIENIHNKCCLTVSKLFTQKGTDIIKQGNFSLKSDFKSKLYEKHFTLFKSKNRSLMIKILKKEIFNDESTFFSLQNVNLLVFCTNFEIYISANWSFQLFFLFWTHLRWSDTPWSKYARLFARAILDRTINRHRLHII